MGKLTLSMIVKNEEKYLRDCLESVKGVVDEIVIVDTGSTDNTVEIAGAYGAQIYNFEWVNDFSAARNFSLSKCTGDWILYLDADERLSKESVKELKKITSENKLQGVYCSIYSVDEINNKPQLMKYTRLFKNSPGIRFEGKAHEQIEFSLEKKGYRFVDSSIIITHLGYNLDREGLRKKADRNLKLLLEDYNSAESSYTAFQLGNTYSILDNKEKASEYYSIAMNDSKLSKEYYGICAAYVADYYMKLNKIEIALDMLEKGLQKSPDHPLLNLVGSEIMFKAGNGELSAELCKKAYLLNNKLSDKKTGTGALDIIIEKDKILYHGLNVSVQKGINEGIQYFLQELENNFSKSTYKFEDEVALIVSLAGNEIIPQEMIEKFRIILSDYNLEFYLGLLEKYNSVDIKIKLIGEALIKFDNNVLVWNKLGLAYSKADKTEKAVNLFEQLLTRFPSEPSPVFYLISLYFQTKDYGKLEELIKTSKKNFKGNMLFNQHITTIEKKLEHIV